MASYPILILTSSPSAGPDRGTQYRSAIYYHSPEQKEIAERVMEEIKDKHPLVKQGGKIATEITEAGKWWSAEDYHQGYLDQNPSGYTCPTHRCVLSRMRFTLYFTCLTENVSFFRLWW